MKWWALLVVTYMAVLVTCFGQNVERSQIQVSVEKQSDEAVEGTAGVATLTSLSPKVDKPPHLSVSLNNPVTAKRRRPRMRTREEIMKQYRSFHEKFDRVPSSSRNNSSGNGTSANTQSYPVTRISQPLPPNSLLTNDSCLLMDSVTNMPRNHHILLFVDSKFYPLYYNWHLHFLDVCGAQRLNHLELVCMDSNVALQLADIGMKCSPHSFVMDSKDLYYTKKQALVWLKRLEVIIFYLEHGVDLVLSDTDAIWRADPFVDINRHYNEAQIIASKGSFPHTLHSLWGATVCMGFVFFRASPFTTRFMQEVLIDMRSRSQMMERIQEEVVYLQYQRQQQLNAYSSADESVGSDTTTNQNSSVIDENHQQGLENEPPEPEVNIRQRYLRGTSLMLSSTSTGSLPLRRGLDANEPQADNVQEEEEGDTKDLGTQSRSGNSSSPVIEAPIELPWEYSIAFHTFLSRLPPSEAVQAYNQALRDTYDLLLTGNHSEIQRRIPLFSIRDQEGYKPDDQYSANYLLHRLQVQWSRNPMPIIEGDVLTVEKGIMDGAFLRANSSQSSSNKHSSVTADEKHTIVLLSHLAYPRNCTGIPFERRTRSRGVINARRAVGNEHVVVAHCVMAPGDAYKKFLSLRSYRLWHRDAPRLRAIDYTGSHSIWHAPDKHPVMSPRITIHDSSKDEAQILADPAFQAFARQWRNIARGHHPPHNGTDAEGEQSPQEILWMLQAMEPRNRKSRVSKVRPPMPHPSINESNIMSPDTPGGMVKVMIPRGQRREQLRNRKARRRGRFRDRQMSPSGPQMTDKEAEDEPDT